MSLEKYTWPQNMDTVFLPNEKKKRETGVPGEKPSNRNEPNLVFFVLVFSSLVLILSEINREYARVVPVPACA